ncbi:inorganic phosphate transporter [Nakamurella lactea]|uniref:inorganic phosphate transporter n=1 Tax=Nakamurella lactea TaxID=459515 RepID=UPI00041D8A02|nr:inorganic phosphate transporter [Nakamurella lactea]
MTAALFTVILVVITALIFDFTNGFHDSANAVATAVATKAMSPRVAVVLAAVLNVTGAFLSTEVAKTISGGIVDDALVTPAIVFAGLVGAILWNLVTWLLGLPSSSSHALFGGLIGAVLVGAGFAGVHFDVVVAKVLVPAVAAPLVAGLVAALATRLGYWISGRGDQKQMNVGFRYGQAVSSSLVALAHGTSDGQKTMGVITLVLIVSGYQASGTGPAFWVVITAGLAIGLGTASGGWRIMRTLGHGLTSMAPLQGFAASTASTAAILSSAHMGFGLSTTQVSTGAIVGAGLGRRGGKVSWKTARRMVWAWLVTLPAAAAVGAVAAFVIQIGTAGVVAMFVVLLLASLAIWLIARRNPVHAGNVGETEPPPLPTMPPAAPAALVMPKKRKKKKKGKKKKGKKKGKNRSGPGTR